MKTYIPDTYLFSVLSDEQNLCGGPLWPYMHLLWNSTGNSNGYHGIVHTLSAVEKLYYALSWYKENNIIIEHPRELMVGGFVHDRNHPGKKQPDYINISIALDAVCAFIIKIGDNVDFEFIQKVVKSTEFGPNGQVHTATTEEERILRDADLSQGQSFNPRDIGLIMWGLSEEMGLSSDAMLEAQEGFLGSFKPESAWGKSVYTPEFINANLHRIRMLRNHTLSAE
jgi:hypothetical protein